MLNIRLVLLATLIVLGLTAEQAAAAPGATVGGQGQVVHTCAS